ncbi:hypothetical protein T484DRAFT_3645200, partial [Baffinella frigidus]
RQRCLRGADLRLDVLRGHELRRRPRVRPGAPRGVQRRRSEASELRQQLLGGNGLRLRGRRLRVRGGKERLEGRGSAVVEAKKRSQLERRSLVLAPGRDRAESCRDRVLERRDRVRRRVGDNVVTRRSREHAGGVRGGARAAGRVIVHHARERGGLRRDLGLGPLHARRVGPGAPRPDLAHCLGAHAELWRDGLALRHRATPQLSHDLKFRAQLEDFERACGSEPARVVLRRLALGKVALLLDLVDVRRRRAGLPCFATPRIAFALFPGRHQQERSMGLRVLSFQPGAMFRRARAGGVLE